MAQRPSISARLEAVRATLDQAALIEALEDPASLVVEAAAKRISAGRAAGALLRAYCRLHEGGSRADSGCWARMAILEAFGRLDAPEGEEAARLAIRSVQVEVLGNGPIDSATGLRVAAAGLFATLQVRGALLDLAWLLHDFEPNASCSFQERPYAKLAPRAAAAKAIGALGESTGAAILAVKLAFPGEELPDCLVECMDALAQLKEPRLIELLAPWLSHGDPYLAAGAGAALASGAGEASVSLLEAAILAGARDAREPLLYALASIRARSAVAALERFARHDDLHLSGLAKQVLGA